MKVCLGTEILYFNIQDVVRAIMAKVTLTTLLSRSFFQDVWDRHTWCPIIQYSSDIYHHTSSCKPQFDVYFASDYYHTMSNERDLNKFR